MKDLLDNPPVDERKSIRSLIIEKVGKLIDPKGETRKIRIYGSANAVFTLTIKNSSGCSILKEELEWVKIPASGSYSIAQEFPALESGKTSEKYDITITPSADAYLAGFLYDVNPNFIVSQYADQSVSLTYTASTAHDPIGGTTLTISGGNITKTGPAKKWSENMSGYSSTTSTVNLTSGSVNAIYAKDNIPFFDDCITGSTAIKRIVVNDDDELVEKNIIKLKPAPQASDGTTVTSTNLGAIKGGMRYFGKVSYDKTVEGSIDEDGSLIGEDSCSELTDRFRLSDNHKLFEGMTVFKNGEYISEVKSIGEGDDCDPLKDITLISKHIIRNKNVLTFERRIGGLVEAVASGERTDGIKLIDIGQPKPPCDDSIIISSSEYIPHETELTFDDGETIVSGRIFTKNSGSAGVDVEGLPTAGTMSVAIDFNVVRFSVEDVAYTLDLDKLITKVPNAYDQEVITTKNTAVTIYPKLYDTDYNALTKTFTIITTPKHGVTSLVELDSNILIYTPYTDFVGEDSIGFTTEDGTNSSDVKTIYITVK